MEQDAYQIAPATRGFRRPGVDAHRVRRSNCECAGTDLHHICRRQVIERLAFFDSDAFDSSLASALGSNPNQLEVTFPGNTRVNQMPPRVNAWLTQVQKNNGTVVAKDPANPRRGFLGRGMIADVIDLISWYRERSQRQAQLATADNYNATLLYDSKSGVLKNIVFSRK